MKYATSTQRWVGKNMKVFWNEDYTSIKHNFDTSRKSNNIVSLIKETQELPSQLKEVKDIPLLEIVDPYDVTDISVTDSLISKWLDSDYVQALKDGKDHNLSTSQGFPWDVNTYNFARAHTHGLIASVDHVFNNGGRCGSLSSGLHHASPSYGLGFCTINGIALSAIHAYSKGLHPLILDFDAHCGGGTMKFLKGFNRTARAVFGESKPPIYHVDVSTNGFDSYENEGLDWSYLHINKLGDDYLEDIKKALDVAKIYANDKTVFIYNAGIDPVGSHGIDDEVIKQRELIVSKFVGDNPAIFALAGGYSGSRVTRDDVAKTHLLNIKEWAWKTK